NIRLVRNAVRARGEPGQGRGIMLIGVPKEVKDHEFRVAITPAGVREYAARGHQVLIERSAGEGSGFSDAEYRAAGAEVVIVASEVFGRSQMIVKVKEPVSSEYDLLQPDQ